MKISTLSSQPATTAVPIKGISEGSMGVLFQKFMQGAASAIDEKAIEQMEIQQEDADKEILDLLAFFELHLQEQEEGEGEGHSALYGTIARMIDSVPSQRQHTENLFTLISAFSSMQNNQLVETDAENYTRHLYKILQTLKQASPIFEKQVCEMQAIVQQPNVQYLQFSNGELQSFVKALDEKVQQVDNRLNTLALKLSSPAISVQNESRLNSLSFKLTSRLTEAQEEEHSALHDKIADMIEMIPVQAQSKEHVLSLISSFANMQNAQFAETDAESYIQNLNKIFETLTQISPMSASQIREFQGMMQQLTVKNIKLSNGELQSLIKALDGKVQELDDRLNSLAVKSSSSPSTEVQKESRLNSLSFKLTSNLTEAQEEHSALHDKIVDMIEMIPVQAQSKEHVLSLISSFANMQNAQFAEADAESYIQNLNKIFETLTQISPTLANQARELQGVIQQSTVKNIQFSNGELQSFIQALQVKAQELDSKPNLLSSALSPLLAKGQNKEQPITSNLNSLLSNRLQVSPQVQKIDNRVFKTPLLSIEGQENGYAIEKAIPFVSGEMSKVQQFSLHLGTGQSSELQSSKFIQEVQQLISKASFQQNGVQSKLVIKLFPEHLGSIQIELVQDSKETVARIIATSTQTKELLDKHMASLKQAFTSQQLNIDKVDIMNAPEQSLANNQERRDEKKEQQHMLQEERQEDEKSSSFNDSFEEALINYNV
ncbi:flagellar hook-length control protein FliK [Priestia megaterium]|nr:flagellar hook-length control protein FliK [Priestia megaterium]